LADNLAFHAQHRGGRVLLFGTNMPDGNELACLYSTQIPPGLGQWSSVPSRD